MLDSPVNFPVYSGAKRAFPAEYICMHCPHCGRHNRADATFCDACGTALAAPADRGDWSSPAWRHQALDRLAEAAFVGRQAALEDALAGRGRHRHGQLADSRDACYGLT
jgi:hypothetical protein